MLLTSIKLKHIKDLIHLITNYIKDCYRHTQLIFIAHFHLRAKLDNKLKIGQ